MTLELAPHVGSYVAATEVAGGALLAIALAAGRRGAHRVSVLDTQSWQQVAAFPIPSRAKSGVTPIDADGEILLANDDHSITAFVARTGERLWQREFPAPASVRLLDAAGGRLLVSVTTGERGVESRLLRVADGADEAVVPVHALPGLMAVALAADGSVVVAGMRSVDVVQRDGSKRTHELVTKRFGAMDAVGVDDDARRCVLGTRAGEVLVMDLGTGAASTVLELESQVRSVGFHRGAPWALDGGGRLRILGEGDAALAVDLGLSTYGGILSPDGSRISLGDFETRSFRVRRVPSNQELFATNPGFECRAVGIDASGALVVADSERLLRLDAESGKLRKIGTAADDISRLSDGTLVFFASQVRALAPGAKSAVKLARAIDDASAAAGQLFAMSGRVAEIWDIATAKRTFRLDLDETWVGETNETLRLVHLGSDGKPWIHVSDGTVCRAEQIDQEEGFLARLSPDGTLWIHPDGTSLYWARERTITRLDADFSEGPALPLAIDANVTKLVFSPSGKRLVVFHRNGRLSSVDLVANTAVAIASPETSAADRAPNEIFVVDLMVPHGCAFGRDEQNIAFSDAGGVAFADASTGALLGRLLVANDGKSYVVTDGASFDWPGAKSKKPVTSEVLVLEANRVLDTATLLARRAPGILGRLTR